MTLTEEILQNISDFKMAPFDAEANVISAHMEACLRDIQIVSECEAAGIIMESDDWNGEIIPKRNDENIIKYIFLFLPRLIINICKKIHAWWTDLKQKNIDKTKAELDESMFNDLSGKAAILCAEVNKRINGNVVYEGSGFVYMSRIKNVNSIRDNYEMFQSRFDKYKDVLISISEMSNGDQAVNMLNVAMESTAPIASDLVTEDWSYPVLINGFTNGFAALNKFVNEAISNIQNSMLDIESRYKIMLGKHMSVGNGLNMSILERYMKYVETVEDTFNRFSFITSKDIEEIIFASSIITTKLAEWRKELLDKRESPSERKELAEKLDKWGVK